MRVISLAGYRSRILWGISWKLNISISIIQSPFVTHNQVRVLGSIKYITMGEHQRDEPMLRNG